MELATLEKKNLVTFFTEGDQVDAILKAIEKKALEFVPDVSTPKGRDEVKAQVTLIVKSKVYLEKKRKELSTEYKEIPRKIDANGKRSFDFLTKLQATVRLALTEWEAEEKLRVIAKAEKLAAEKLQKEIDDCQDFADLMNDKFDRDAKDKAAELEQMQKEIDLERERVERERVEQQAFREKEIAREAAAKAEQEKADAIAREKAAIAAAEVAETRRIEQQAKDQEARKKAEEDAKQAAVDAEIKRVEEVKLSQERAKAEAEATEKRAAEAMEAAEKRAIVAAEAARLAEIARQEAEAEQVKKDQAKREANTKHIGGIRKEAKEDLIQLGLSEGEAKKVILAINSGSVRHLSIQY